MEVVQRLWNIIQKVNKRTTVLLTCFDPLLFKPALKLAIACDTSYYGVGAVIAHVLPNGEDHHGELNPSFLIHNAEVPPLGHHSSHQTVGYCLYLKLLPNPTLFLIVNDDQLNIHFVKSFVL